MLRDSARQSPGTFLYSARPNPFFLLREEPRRWRLHPDQTQFHNTKAVGEYSEMMVMGACARKGYLVLKPFGDNLRYDFVLDDGEIFYRVQCKTGRVLNGVTILFPVCSSSMHRGGVRRGYAGQIEFFGVYAPEIDQCFLVPFSDVQHCRSSANLHLGTPRNGQLKKVRPAEKYRI